ncbi:MAG TPA: hypothetical protein VK539_06875 [Myxococcaceae bacterium]|nr:hypothetical protein [Myxococcaceae bacterium]
MARINEPRVTPRTQPRTQTTQPTPPRAQTARPTTPPRTQAPQQQDRFEGFFNAVNRGANAIKSVTDSVVAGARTANSRATRGAGIAGTLATVAQLPGAARTAFRDVRNAVQNATAETVTRATGSVASVVSTTASAAKGIIETGNLVRDFRGIRDAASRTILNRVPDAARGVVNRVAGETAQQVLNGASRQVARNVAARVAGEGLEVAARAGVSAAREAAPHVLAATAGRAASRFVPGLNVGIAVADSVAFGSEVANAIRGDVNPGKLVTSGITALGSIAAATNIPVVSQVGAAVSTVSSFVGSFFG